MNTIKNKSVVKFLLTALVMLGSFSSCKKDFFDINKNPNNPADVPISYLLPSAEAAIAHASGNDLKIFGGIWGQYWTQSSNSSQYRAYDQYSPSANDFDNLWANLYSDALMDLSKIISKATPQESQYVACAKILQAYTYQVLTDNFGDIPFTEALQAESGKLAPHYDSQKDVYDGIIKLVNDGLALIDSAKTGQVHVPGNNDVLLGGNMYKWKKFGNTLKLKIYLRLSEVDPVKAAAGVHELEASSAIFLGAGEEVRMNYINSGGNSNPLYSSIVGLNFIQNLVASSTCVDYMLANNDFRVDVFYTSEAGNPQGDYNLTSKAVGFPGTVTGGLANPDSAPATASAPVKLMTGYESLFLQAEAAARGWTGGSAQTLYEAGITDNFVTYGFTSTDASNYYLDTTTTVPYPTGGSVPDQIKAIITQKWAAMCGNQTNEAWIESRRTNYPDFFTVSVNSTIGQQFPQRMFYPSSEESRNSSFPGQKLITEKVWWDVN